VGDVNRSIDVDSHRKYSQLAAELPKSVRNDKNMDDLSVMINESLRGGRSRKPAGSGIKQLRG